MDQEKEFEKDIDYLINLREEGILIETDYDDIVIKHNLEREDIIDAVMSRQLDKQAAAGKFRI